MAYIDATRRSQVNNHAHAVEAKKQAKMRRKLAALLLAARSSARINHDLHAIDATPARWRRGELRDCSMACYASMAWGVDV